MDEEMVLYWSAICATELAHIEFLKGSHLTHLGGASFRLEVSEPTTLQWLENTARRHIERVLLIGLTPELRPDLKVEIGAIGTCQEKALVPLISAMKA